MRIAKPILLISTPIGVIAGVREAWRFHANLAVLMAILVSIIGLFLWLTLRRVLQERAVDRVTNNQSNQHPS